MAVKCTFTLDVETLQILRRLAEREGKSQSQTVRDAVAYYATRDDKLTASERDAWLSSFDQHVARVAPRTRQALDEEISAVRTSRHGGWNRQAPDGTDGGDR